MSSGLHLKQSQLRSLLDSLDPLQKESWLNGHRSAEDRRPPLLAAVERNDRDEALLLLSEGARLDVVDGHGWTALDSAARFASVDLLLDLLLSADGQRCLAKQFRAFLEQRSSTAASSSHRQATPLTHLLKRVCTPGDLPLRLAMVTLMMAVIERATMRHYASSAPPLQRQRSWFERVRSEWINASSHRGDTLLHAATLTDSDCLIKLLLLNGADATVSNSAGQSPLDFLAKTATAVLGSSGRHSLSDQFCLLLRRVADAPHSFVDRSVCHAWTCLRNDVHNTAADLPAAADLLAVQQALFHRRRQHQHIDITRHPQRRLLAMGSVQLIALTATSSLSSSSTLSHSSPSSSSPSSSTLSHSTSSTRDHSVRHHHHRRPMSMPPTRLALLADCNDVDGRVMSELPPSKRAHSSNDIVGQAPSDGNATALQRLSLVLIVCTDVVLVAEEPHASGSWPPVAPVAQLPPDWTDKLSALRFVSALPLDRLHIFDLPDHRCERDTFTITNAVQLVYVDSEPSSSGSWTLLLADADAKIALWQSVVAFQLAKVPPPPFSLDEQPIIEATHMYLQEPFTDEWRGLAGVMYKDRVELFSAPRQLRDRPALTVPLGDGHYALTRTAPETRRFELGASPFCRHYVLCVNTVDDFFRWVRALGC